MTHYLLYISKRECGASGRVRYQKAKTTLDDKLPILKTRFIYESGLVKYGTWYILLFLLKNIISGRFVAHQYHSVHARKCSHLRDAAGHSIVVETTTPWPIAMVAFRKQNAVAVARISALLRSLDACLIDESWPPPLAPSWRIMSGATQGRLQSLRRNQPPTTGGRRRSLYTRGRPGGANLGGPARACQERRARVGQISRVSASFYHFRCILHE